MADTPAIRRSLERVELPPNFSWGVGASGYQIEGGINTPVGPRNNWARWEECGRIEPTGDANRFWVEPSPMLDPSAAAGCDAFRYGIEWSRVQPEPSGHDDGALDHYAQLIAEGHARGIAPIMTCCHFTHPEWMGSEPWLADPDLMVARFTSYCALLATGLNGRLVKRGLPTIRRWVTLNELNVLPIGAYLAGETPPARTGALRRTLAMRDVLVEAHVCGYDAIHDAYRDAGWPAPEVSTNNAAFAGYELDLMLVDVLTARDRGVPLDQLDGDIEKRRTGHERDRHATPTAMPSLAGRALASVERALGRRHGGVGSLPRTLAAIRRSPRPTKLDFVAADYYSPFLEDALRRPGRRVAGGERRWRADIRLDEFTPNPAGVLWYLEQLGRYDRPVLFLESGMGSWGRRPRVDGWRRPEFLRATLLAMVCAMDRGVDIVGYHHWSIVDNYEWGTYMPRFGLHAAERDGGRVTFSARDALGDDASATFRRLQEALAAPGGSPERLRAFAEGGGHGR